MTITRLWSNLEVQTHVSMDEWSDCFDTNIIIITYWCLCCDLGSKHISETCGTCTKTLHLGTLSSYDSSRTNLRHLMIFPSPHLDASENSDTPKSSILIRFSSTNHPFWGTPIYGNTHFVPLLFALREKPKFCHAIHHFSQGEEGGPPEERTLKEAVFLDF